MSLIYLFRELGNTGQVIYCLTKAMKADPLDVDAKWDCASLYAELNDIQKAIECLEQLLAVRPSDVEVCKMVAKVYNFLVVNNFYRSLGVLGCPEYDLVFLLLYIRIFCKL